MYVYLSGSGEEVSIPQAVAAEVSGDDLTLLDSSWQVVAVFPAISVILYSLQRMSEDNRDAEERRLAPDES